MKPLNGRIIFIISIFLIKGCATSFERPQNDNSFHDACAGDCGAELCNQTTCPKGCCDAKDTCRDGTGDEFCGAGGVKCTHCLLNGLICLQQACTDLGQCTTGETMNCGNCGVRACDPVNNVWGPCENEGACAPDDLETGEECGNCGINQRTCTSSCEWSSWSCTDEGVCTPGETGSETCGNCGTRQRTCTSSCGWSSWSSCSGEGVCSPSQTRRYQECCEESCNSDCTWSGVYQQNSDYCDFASFCLSSCECW